MARTDRQCRVHHWRGDLGVAWHRRTPGRGCCLCAAPDRGAGPRWFHSGNFRPRRTRDFLEDGRANRLLEAWLSGSATESKRVSPLVPGSETMRLRGARARRPNSASTVCTRRTRRRLSGPVRGMPSGRGNLGRPNAFLGSWSQNGDHGVHERVLRSCTLSHTFRGRRLASVAPSGA